MYKSPLTGRQMACAEYVERAAWWSRELTRWRARGPGDLENAMRTIEREYGLDYWLLWRLRYRATQIKDIGVVAYSRLEAAYHAECERQLRKLKHELAITEAITGIDDPAVCSAAVVVDETQAQQGDAPRLSSELDD